MLLTFRIRHWSHYERDQSVSKGWLERGLSEVVYSVDIHPKGLVGGPRTPEEIQNDCIGEHADVLSGHTRERT
jgi:hypothetical protein